LKIAGASIAAIGAQPDTAIRQITGWTWLWNSKFEAKP